MTTKTKPTRRPAKVDYYWFQGESVAALYNQLYHSIGGNPRLEVRLSGEKMMLTVVPEGGNAKVTANPPINDSHACPPTCP